MDRRDDMLLIGAEIWDASRLAIVSLFKLAVNIDSDISGTLVSAAAFCLRECKYLAPPKAPDPQNTRPRKYTGWDSPKAAWDGN